MQTAYVAPFLPILHSSHLTSTIPRSTYTTPCRKRLRSTAPRCKLEPVEDGVSLPKPSSNEALLSEAAWLADELTKWLDAEWKQAEPQPIHAEIGALTGRVYARQRMEGEDDLSSVLIAIGSELEGMDFTDAFVGPWNVANKTSELLIRYRAGPRLVEDEYVPSMETVRLSGNAERGREIMWNSSQVPRKRVEEGGQRFAVAPSLADHFEKLKFLRDVLDGSIPKKHIDGAVAVALGYTFDTETRTWDASNVEDEHFKNLGNEPPDLLGEEKEAAQSESLQYLASQLRVEDEMENEKLEEGLYTVIETLHGVEMTRIQMEDEKDHEFHKRMIIAKWLHLHGGFL